MTRKKKRRNLFFGITSRTLMTISAVLLLVSSFSYFINPASAWFMTIFGLLYPLLLVGNVLLLCWALFRWSNAAFIPIAALLPTFIMAGNFYQFPKKEDAQVNATDGIRIISYNVGRFSLPQPGEKLSRKECADSVIAFLKNEDADIICLQEFYTRDPQKIMTYLSDKMKGYDIKYYVNVTDNGCYGNVTLSRFPAFDKGKIDFEHSSNLALYSDYMLNGEPFRIYNCHFESYNISLSRLASSLEKDYRQTVKDTEAKMKKSIARRPRQVDQVLKDIENCPEQTIVTGDFNDTPMSYTYWRLSRKRKDTFKEAGTGFGATFSKLRPLLRIDYILVPEKCKVLSHNIIHKRFSDHYPIESVISINNTDNERH